MTKVQVSSLIKSVGYYDKLYLKDLGSIIKDFALEAKKDPNKDLV
jgi:hypothetical protein